MTERPTPHQRKAIALALPSGYLRRLPGGYWVGNETPWRGNSGAVLSPSLGLHHSHDGQTVGADGYHWHGFLKAGVFEEC